MERSSAPHQHQPASQLALVISLALSSRRRRRAWVDARYARVPLREKDAGTKLEVLYAAYAMCAPAVHAKVLGRNTFAKMLNAVFPNVGPHRNKESTVTSMYLLRCEKKKGVFTLLKKTKGPRVPGTTGPAR